MSFDSPLETVLQFIKCPNMYVTLLTSAGLGSSHFVRVSRYVYHLAAARKIGVRQALLSAAMLGTLSLIVLTVCGLGSWYGVTLVYNKEYTGGVMIQVRNWNFNTQPLTAFILGKHLRSVHLQSLYFYTPSPVDMSGKVYHTSELRDIVVC